MMSKHEGSILAQLPVRQLAILAICRAAEPIAMTSVYPYLPEMIESWGVKQEDIGRYGGIVFGIFALAQAPSGIFWAIASDRYGRKPTVMMCLGCCAVMSLSWGVSTSLPLALISRTLLGLSSGDVGVIRTMVAELVPQKHLQPTAYSIMPMVWTMGSTLGPAVGGLLAKPTETMPAIFGNNSLFIKYPFLLPNLLAFFLYMIGLTNAFLYVEETLQHKQHQKDYGIELGKKIKTMFKALFRCSKERKPFRHPPSIDESEATLLTQSPTSLLDPSSPTSTSASTLAPTANVRKPSPSYSSVLHRQSVYILATYFTAAFTSVSFEQLLPVFMHHPPEKHTASNRNLFKFSGGFGIDADRIGTILLINGILGVLMQFTLYPKLAKVWGVLNLLRFSFVLLPIACLITPYTALINSPLLQQFAMYGILLIKVYTAITIFPCLFIMQTNAASSIHALGMLNGMGVLCSGLGRAIGPALTGWLYTRGVEIGYVILPWWSLAFLSVVGTLPIIWVVETDNVPQRDDHGQRGGGADDEEALVPRDDEEVDNRPNIDAYVTENHFRDTDEDFGIKKVHRRDRNPVDLTK